MKVWLNIFLTRTFFYAFALGVILGTVYYYTKNIISVIALHSIFNFLGNLTSLFLLPQNTQTDFTIIGVAIQLIIILPAIFMARRNYLKYKDNI